MSNAAKPDVQFAVPPPCYTQEATSELQEVEPNLTVGSQVGNGKPLLKGGNNNNNADAPHHADESPRTVTTTPLLTPSFQHHQAAPSLSLALSCASSRSPGDVSSKLVHGPSDSSSHQRPRRALSSASNHNHNPKHQEAAPPAASSLMHGPNGVPGAAARERKENAEPDAALGAATSSHGGGAGAMMTPLQPPVDTQEEEEEEDAAAEAVAGEPEVPETQLVEDIPETAEVEAVGTAASAEGASLDPQAPVAGQSPATATPQHRHESAREDEAEEGGTGGSGAKEEEEEEGLDPHDGAPPSSFPRRQPAEAVESIKSPVVAVAPGPSGVSASEAELLEAETLPGSPPPAETTEAPSLGAPALEAEVTMSVEEEEEAVGKREEMQQEEGKPGCSSGDDAAMAEAPPTAASEPRRTTDGAPLKQQEEPGRPAVPPGTPAVSVDGEEMEQQEPGGGGCGGPEDTTAGGGAASAPPLEAAGAFSLEQAVAEAAAGEEETGLQEESGGDGMRAVAKGRQQTMVLSGEGLDAAEVELRRVLNALLQPDGSPEDVLSCAVLEAEMDAVTEEEKAEDALMCRWWSVLWLLLKERGGPVAARNRTDGGDEEEWEGLWLASEAGAKEGEKDPGGAGGGRDEDADECSSSVGGDSWIEEELRTEAEMDASEMSQWWSQNQAWTQAAVSLTAADRASQLPFASAPPAYASNSAEDDTAEGGAAGVGVIDAVLPARDDPTEPGGDPKAAAPEGASAVANGAAAVAAAAAIAAGPQLEGEEVEEEQQEEVQRQEGPQGHEERQTEGGINEAAGGDDGDEAIEDVIQEAAVRREDDAVEEIEEVPEKAGHMMGRPLQEEDALQQEEAVEEAVQEEAMKEADKEKDDEEGVKDVVEEEEAVKEASQKADAEEEGIEEEEREDDAVEVVGVVEETGKDPVEVEPDTEATVWESGGAGDEEPMRAKEEDEGAPGRMDKEDSDSLPLALLARPAPVAAAVAESSPMLFMRLQRASRAAQGSPLAPNLVDGRDTKAAETTRGLPASAEAPEEDAACAATIEVPEEGSADPDMVPCTLQGMMQAAAAEDNNNRGGGGAAADEDDSEEGERAAEDNGTQVPPQGSSPPPLQLLLDSQADEGEGDEGEDQGAQEGRATGLSTGHICLTRRIKGVADATTVPDSAPPSPLAVPSPPNDNRASPSNVTPVGILDSASNKGAPKSSCRPLGSPTSASDALRRFFEQQEQGESGGGGKEAEQGKGGKSPRALSSCVPGTDGTSEEPQKEVAEEEPTMRRPRGQKGAPWEPPRSKAATAPAPLAACSAGAEEEEVEASLWLTGTCTPGFDSAFAHPMPGERGYRGPAAAAAAAEAAATRQQQQHYPESEVELNPAPVALAAPAPKQQRQQQRGPNPPPPVALCPLLQHPPSGPSFFRKRPCAASAAAQLAAAVAKRQRTGAAHPSPAAAAKGGKGEATETSFKDEYSFPNSQPETSDQAPAGNDTYGARAEEVQQQPAGAAPERRTGPKMEDPGYGGGGGRGRGRGKGKVPMVVLHHRLRSSRGQRLAQGGAGDDGDGSSVAARRQRLAARQREAKQRLVKEAAELKRSARERRVPRRFQETQDEDEAEGQGNEKGDKKEEEGQQQQTVVSGGERRGRRSSAGAAGGGRGGDIGGGKRQREAVASKEEQEPGSKAPRGKSPLTPGASRAKTPLKPRTAASAATATPLGCSKCRWAKTGCRSCRCGEGSRGASAAKAAVAAKEEEEEEEEKDGGLLCPGTSSRGPGSRKSVLQTQKLIWAHQGDERDAVQPSQDVVEGGRGPSSSRGAPPAIFLLTGLEGQARAAALEAIKSLGGKPVQDFPSPPHQPKQQQQHTASPRTRAASKPRPSDVTVVTPLVKETQEPRTTAKYLTALAAGCRVVTPEWLQAASRGAPASCAKMRRHVLHELRDPPLSCLAGLPLHLAGDRRWKATFKQVLLHAGAVPCDLKEDEGGCGGGPRAAAAAAEGTRGEPPVMVIANPFQVLKDSNPDLTPRDARQLLHGGTTILPGEWVLQALKGGRLPGPANPPDGLEAAANRGAAAAAAAGGGGAPSCSKRPSAPTPSTLQRHTHTPPPPPKHHNQRSHKQQLPQRQGSHHRTSGARKQQQLSPGPSPLRTANELHGGGDGGGREGRGDEGFVGEAVEPPEELRYMRGQSRTFYGAWRSEAPGCEVVYAGDCAEVQAGPGERQVVRVKALWEESTRGGTRCLMRAERFYSPQDTIFPESGLPAGFHGELFASGHTHEALALNSLVRRVHVEMALPGSRPPPASSSDGSRRYVCRYFYDHLQQQLRALP